MVAYDVIGDIHGRAEPLEDLLDTLGYREINGVYRHPQGNKICFMGDFIDRGDNHKRVLHIVRAMVDSGNAVAVMGNHEFNAICYTLPDGRGGYLRAHSKKNTGYHTSFLNEFPFGSPEYHDVVNWFKTLPLFIETPDFNAIHACWDEQQLNKIRPYLDGNNCLHDQAYQEYAQKSGQAYEAIEILLKGPEVILPNGMSYTVGDGSVRNDARIKWWEDESKPLVDRLFMVGAQLSQKDIDDINGLSLSETFNRAANAKPLFLGHYWLSGTPEILPRNIACLDYSGNRNDMQVGYQYRGEKILSATHFVLSK